MTQQWEKGLYEVIAGSGGVAISRIPVVDPRGFDPFAVFSYLGVMREALAITSRKVLEKVVEYARMDTLPDTVRKVDIYLQPLYEHFLPKRYGGYKPTQQDITFDNL